MLSLRRQREQGRQRDPDYELRTSPTGTHRAWYGQQESVAEPVAEPVGRSTTAGTRFDRQAQMQSRRGRYGRGDPDSGMSRAEQLADEYQRAYDEARQANEQRYLDILQGYGDARQSSMDYLQGMGEQRESDIRSDWYGREQGAMADLVDRGLRGTTVASTTSAQFQRGMQQDVGRLQDSLQQQYLGATAPIDQARLAFMERREDAYPDYNQMLGLQSGLGAAAAYGSGSGSVPGGAAGVSAAGYSSLPPSPLAAPQQHGFGAMRNQTQPQGFAPGTQQQMDRFSAGQGQANVGAYEMGTPDTPHVPGVGYGTTPLPGAQPGPGIQTGGGHQQTGVRPIPRRRR